MNGILNFDGTVWTHYGQNMHSGQFSLLRFGRLRSVQWRLTSAFILKIKFGEEFTINSGLIRDSISCIRVHNDTLVCVRLRTGQNDINRMNGYLLRGREH